MAPRSSQHESGHPCQWPPPQPWGSIPFPGGCQLPGGLSRACSPHRHKLSAIAKISSHRVSPAIPEVIGTTCSATTGSSQALAQKTTPSTMRSTCLTAPTPSHAQRKSPHGFCSYHLPALCTAESRAPSSCLPGQPELPCAAHQPSSPGVTPIHSAFNPDSNIF